MTTLPVEVTSVLSQVKVKKTNIRPVHSWEVGVTKATLVKFNLPYETQEEQEAARRLIPHELRRGSNRDQRVENRRHVDFAQALGKSHKTVSEREGNRPVDTADERMETPPEGQASAPRFWQDLHSEGFRFLDGEWFVKIGVDGRTSLVIELRFVHKRILSEQKSCLESQGITPTPFSFKMREKLFKNFFSRAWYRCKAFSNSAHADPTKTYNFFGEGRRGHIYRLYAEEGKVFFR